MGEWDPLTVLDVIDRLQVGPIRVERRRLTAPYHVTRGDKSDTFDFVYKYGEDVFEPEDPASLNLASVLATQVAFNYGLFCREIVFEGLFDRHDQRFISDMMHNTAREILVKKFFEPNPFLRGDAARLPAERQEKYVRAAVAFVDQPSGTAGGETPSTTHDLNWETDRSRHAVLSSGGKDSLLSYGLLREAGREAQPIFINESGRHWYTALNAYRYLAASDPNTARVWTNSDRLFSWMLRHLPFVRQDFASVRSDEYPIRLWTVAVFVFGALPLLRKRGIERLVIGDEYDTTRRLTYRGIAHYDGLYDQSLYFDQAMTRYYQRKGWGVRQFSVLRQSSELLIEKVLAERYPDLQRHQLSCHAAHVEGDRVHPCGRCEKCRRIVAMLVGIGADPVRCGYSQEQVERCLESLSENRLHQEAAGEQQLRIMLREKGILPGSEARSRARRRPEVLKLRFDPERSPFDTIPVDLREPLYRILLEHADGAVERTGRTWRDCDPLAEPALSRPYRFDAPTGQPGSGPPREAGAPTLQNSYLLAEMTWPEAEARLKEVDLALLPVGALEQHGPHLPLDTDAFDADYLARSVAAACSDPKPLVLPAIAYGVSYHHDDYGGTMSISNETLSRLVYDIGMSAARNGITKLVIINGHGGNAPTLQFAAQMINRDGHIFTCVDTGETSDADVEAMVETPNDVHAGEIETSTSLAVRPHLVRLDRARKFVPRFSIRYMDFSSKRGIQWFARTARISSTGVLGDPTKASRQKGERIWAIMIKNLVEFVEDLKRMSLEEIYEKRY